MHSIALLFGFVTLALPLQATGATQDFFPDPGSAARGKAVRQLKKLSPEQRRILEPNGGLLVWTPNSATPVVWAGPSPSEAVQAAGASLPSPSAECLFLFGRGQGLLATQISCPTSCVL